MKVAVCSTKSYDRQFLSAANGESGHELVFFECTVTERRCIFPDNAAKHQRV
jgi:D-lactate dehydrogenase